MDKGIEARIKRILYWYIQYIVFPKIRRKYPTIEYKFITLFCSMIFLKYPL